MSTYQCINKIWIFKINQATRCMTLMRVAVLDSGYSSLELGPTVLLFRVRQKQQSLFISHSFIIQNGRRQIPKMWSVGCYRVNSLQAIERL